MGGRRENQQTLSVVDTEAGLAWWLLFGGCSTSRSWAVGKPPTGGPWQLGERCQVPKGGGSHACSSTHYLTLASVVGELWGIMFGGSSSHVLVGLAWDPASRLAFFDFV